MKNLIFIFTISIFSISFAHSDSLFKSKIHQKNTLLLNNNFGLGFGWGTHRNIGLSYSPYLEKFITNRKSLGISLFGNYSNTIVNDTNIKIQGLTKAINISAIYSYYFKVYKHLSIKFSLGINYGMNRLEFKEKGRLTYEREKWGYNYSGGIGLYYKPKLFRKEKFNKLHISLEFNRPLESYFFLYKINFLDKNLEIIHTAGLGVGYRF